jgi:hypothetical protein
MGRTPADFPGRPGKDVVPTKREHMDLDEKAARHRALDEAHPQELPWYKRWFRKDSRPA